MADAAREFAFGCIGKLAIEKIGHNETKNAIAQKFQPLIVWAVHRRAGKCADMGQRTFEQSTISKGMAERLFKMSEIGLAARRHD